jgi:uncharacterized protein YbjT (DUF2867 family)
LKVAITGATGFTGQRVVRELLGRGHELRALVRRGRAPALPQGVTPLEGDLLNPATVIELLGPADAFVQAASLPPPDLDALVAGLPSRRPLRSVFFSSTSVATRRPAPWQAALVAGEEKIRASAANWTILRPTMIYGDVGDRNMSRLIRFVWRSPAVPLPGGGRSLIQPVHVDDVARAAVDALTCPRAERNEYEIPGAVAGTLREIVEYVGHLLGRRSPVLSLPLAPMAAAARLWSALRLPPRIRADQILRLTEDKAFSYERARADWGYTPRGWREGLGAEVEALRRAGWVR